MRAIPAAALGSALVLVAAGFDTGALYLPGVALVVAAAAATAWVELAARGASIDRERAPALTVEDRELPLPIRIERGIAPLPGGELRDPLRERPFAVGPGLDRGVESGVVFRRRGRRRIPPAVLSIRDPLGLRQRSVESGDGGTVLVLPRVEAIEFAGGDGGERSIRWGFAGEGSAGIETPAVEMEIDGLRPYRRGSPASRIHWPTVARRSEMLERRLIAGADSTPLVVLDASSPIDEAALDRAVRAAASLTMHIAGRGGCALLLPGDAHPATIDARLEAWPRAHARLALVDAADRPPGLRHAPRDAALVWVTAGAPSKASLPATVAARRAYLVAPVTVGGMRAAFTVAGCAGYTLSSLRRRPASTAVAA
jgi:uncharacterized protein (DUF58 family)